MGYCEILANYDCKYERHSLVCLFVKCFGVGFLTVPTPASEGSHSSE